MKNKAIKSISFAALAGFLLLASNALAVSDTSSLNKSTNNSISGQPGKNNAMSLLFVFQTTNASLKPIKDNLYEFSFPINKKDKVLAFTDRPNRESFTVTRDQWVEMIMSGENNFKTNPPNIVLTQANPHIPPIAYQVVGFKKLPGRATYTLRALGTHSSMPPSLERGAVSVYIDDVDITFDCSTTCTTSYLESVDALCPIYTGMCNNVCPANQVNYVCSTT